MIKTTYLYRTCIVLMCVLLSVLSVLPAGA